MKGSITFEFTQGEDGSVTDGLEAVSKYADLLAALHDIWYHFRNAEKYGDQETLTIDEVRKAINEKMDDNGVLHIVFK